MPRSAWICGLAVLGLAGLRLAHGPAEAPALGPVDDAPQSNASREAPTFSGSIGTLLYRSCTPCHHPGGYGPFPITSYEEARRRAKQIAIVTDTRYMPPWKPAPRPQEFLDVRRLSDDEIAQLAEWADAGAPLGDPETVPSPPVFTSDWFLGPPDQVLTMEESYTVPAEGKDHYRSFVIRTNFEDTRFVRAFDFQPDNPKPVHHILTQIDDSGTVARLDAETPGVGFEGMVAEGEFFGREVHGWGPGGTPRFLPKDSTWVLPPGTDFLLDTHFQTTGREEDVRIAIGLYFADEAPRRPMANLSVSASILSIPPGESAYPVDWSFQLPVPMQVISIQPHAHYIARDMRVVAEPPNGETVSLIHIPEWDMNWQDSYRYASTFSLPAGTWLRMRYTFDNTAENDLNPFARPRRIFSGPRSSDEMALFWMQVAVAPQDRDALRRELIDYQHTVMDQSELFDALFDGVVVGFDADKDGFLDAEEDARATTYMNALEDHPHGMAFDFDGDGVLNDQERRPLRQAVALWNGERPLPNPH